jgi:hypothetical protein
MLTFRNVYEKRLAEYEEIYAMAVLAMATYEDTEYSELLKDWEKEEGDHEDSGLHWVLWRNKTTGRAVLAFAGTESQIRDWGANIGNGAFSKSQQYEEGLGIARRFRATNSQLTIVGHSLGGGVASYCSIVLNVPTVVFNSAAPSRLYSAEHLRGSEQQLQVHITRGDQLTQFQDSFAWTGIPNKSIANRTYWGHERHGHSMRHMLLAIDAERRLCLARLELIKSRIRLYGPISPPRR